MAEIVTMDSDPSLIERCIIAAKGQTTLVSDAIDEDPTITLYEAFVLLVLLYGDTKATNLAPHLRADEVEGFLWEDWHAKEDPFLTPPFDPTPVLNGLVAKGHVMRTGHLYSLVQR
jgi:hypothetical protein